MTSGHHDPYALGDTRAAMAETKGHNTARAAARLYETRILHTDRHTMGVGHARSRYLNNKEGDAKGKASGWSEVVTR
uniref:Uncharacterized protein n=1 Tax=Solanum lycopersicum TaxID=4081 RepID=K4D8D0_SOLLC